MDSGLPLMALREMGGAGLEPAATCV